MLEPPPLLPVSIPIEPALAQILEGLPDAIVLLDHQWRITYANQTARDISRIRPEDFNSKTHWEIYPETVGTALDLTYHAVMDTRREQTIKAFFYEPFKLWLHLRVLPVHGGIALYFKDITEQKLHEDQLSRSEERYRILTELSPQCLWNADADGRVVYANQSFLDYIGRDIIPGTGVDYLACIDPADRERVLHTWTQSVATGNDYAIDANLIRAVDGASRCWHLRAAPIRDDSGTVQQWLGTAIDVHEERRAAGRLRHQFTEIDRQRRELETIYHGSPIGMALYEPTELRVIRMNHRQAQILGIAPSDAIGMRYEDLKAGIPHALSLIRRAATGENVLNQDIEGTLDRCPGEHRHWNVNYSPIFDEDGTVRAIAGATIETTLQKRAEAALIQSEKLAAVGRMASSIAHEINNPLESVTNLLYIIGQHHLPPDIQNFLALADQELRRVSIIANQTLRFHKQSTLPREITCTDLFATVLSLYEGRLRNSSISIEKRKRANQPVSCFEGDVRQVLNNLVANAIDAMPTGGRLLLRSREATDWRTGRRGLTLTIADNGTGISPETRARVFEAFFTTKGINGTGLGLWIGNEIVDRHQGRLLLRSSQDPTHRGTVFTLFLPYLPTLSTTTNGYPVAHP